MIVDFRQNQEQNFTNVFYRIQESITRFVLVRGGAGSSKSYSAHQLELIKILNKKYHTLIIRKEASTLFDSCFNLLKDQIADPWKIRHLFKWIYSNQRREIINRVTGKRIVLKGIDDPEKLKSLVGFDRIVIEEATSLTFEDFKELNRRVRGIENIQIILIFNPIDERHWIKKTFYDDVPGKRNRYKEKSTFIDSTHWDNQFLTEDDHEEIENLQFTSPNDYRIYALNQWGKPEIKSPVAANFIYDKHVSDTVRKYPNIPVNLIWDFNVEPFVVLANQEWWDSKQVHHVHYFHEYVIEDGGSVPSMIRLIKSTMDESEISRVIIMGDAMQQKREITQEDNRNAYQQIIDAFKVSKPRFKVPTDNPDVIDSVSLMNFIFWAHLDYKFHSSMKITINELMYTESNPEGKIMKKNRKREDQRSDAIDCVRYFNNVVLVDFSKNWRKYCGNLVTSQSA